MAPGGAGYGGLSGARRPLHGGFLFNRRRTRPTTAATPLTRRSSGCLRVGYASGHEDGRRGVREARVNRRPAGQLPSSLSPSFAAAVTHLL
jgi:hypothetical protein